MSLSNLSNLHLTEDQVSAVNEALSSLETALKPLNVNLSAEERSKYGRVNEQNKLLVNKIYDYAQNQQELRSPDVDWDEFFKDYKDRNFYENVMNRLDALLLKLKNHKILGDYDNYQDALSDYAFASYKAGTKSAGFEEKHRELKQFFTKSNKNQSPKDEKQSPEDKTPSQE